MQCFQMEEEEDDEIDALLSFFVVACILVFAKILLEITIMHQSPLPSQRGSAPLSSQQSALHASQKIALLSSQEGLDGRCPLTETKFAFGMCDLQLPFQEADREGALPRTRTTTMASS